MESPWALTWDDENYYLICYDSDDKIIKHFRVDKMMNIRILDEHREGEEHFKNFDMATYAKHTFGMFGGEEYSVTLNCDTDMADPIIDRFGQDVLIHIIDEESFMAIVKAKVSPVFFAWITNFGGKIRIEGPENVKKLYRDHLKKVLYANFGE